MDRFKPDLEIEDQVSDQELLKSRSGFKTQRESTDWYPLTFWNERSEYLSPTGGVSVTKR